MINCIKENPQESRKEWLAWMFKRAGKKNSNNSDWQFWQQHNKPLEIKDQEMFDKMLKYMHDNSVVAGFVEKPEGLEVQQCKRFLRIEGIN